MEDPYSIVISPILTEKSVAAKGQGKYTFEVAKDANKIEIKDAIQRIFGVKVKKVNVMRIRGKPRRLWRVPEGRTPDWKKAIVTLAPGEKIEAFEGM